MKNIWIESFKIAPIPTVVLFLILCVMGLCLGLIFSRCVFAETVQICQMNIEKTKCIPVSKEHPLCICDKENEYCSPKDCWKGVRE